MNFGISYKIQEINIFLVKCTPAGAQWTSESCSSTQFSRWSSNIMYSNVIGALPQYTFSYGFKFASVCVCPSLKKCEIVTVIIIIILLLYNNLFNVKCEPHSVFVTYKWNMCTHQFIAYAKNGNDFTVPNRMCIL